MSGSPFLPDTPLLRAAANACARRHVRVWLVGGSVRDVLLGRAIHDFDFAVERDAIGVARAVADHLDAPMYVMDAERDTARVVVHENTARIFLDFAGLRGPTLEGDLSGRDFTINAIAVDLVRPDTLIDPFGGRRDLDARYIRAVTDRSLLDDPNRLLRAARLSMQLDFSIESRTRAQIRKSAHLVKTSAAERARDELHQLVALPGLHASLLLLNDLGLLGELMPELPAMRGVAQPPPHHWDVFEHTLRMADVLETLLARAAGIPSQRHAPKAVTAPGFAWGALDKAIGPLRDVLQPHLEKTLSDERPVWLLLKWAALFHDAAKPVTRSVDADGRIRFLEHEEVGADMVVQRTRALRFSSDEVERVRTIVRHHMRPHHLAHSGASRRAIYRFFRDTREAGVDVLLHALADRLATDGPDLDAEGWAQRLDLARTMLDEYFHRHEEAVNPAPLLTGHDVMQALGLQAGPQVGKVLEAVREAQAAGEVKTRQEALALAKTLTDRG